MFRAIPRRLQALQSRAFKGDAMPIYEYQCSSCGHQLESLQKLSDAPLTDCPECTKSTLQKQISAAGFRLSGGGWYETDFKSGTKRNVAEKSDKKEAGESAPAAPGGGHSCGSGGCGACS
jgi:putative FmdB family regulatory protein